MIQIKRPEDCCGCSACAEICAHSAISMQPDKLGFLYPSVDYGKCIECDLCTKVCPIINVSKPRKPTISYAFRHKDQEVIEKSSTAGAFFSIAEKTLIEKGVIFGCSFNTDWSTKHISIEKIEDLIKITGSKYLQSSINNSYTECKKNIREGRQVLFSGTPCQIAGLKGYLRKDYPNLLCVDLICHGIPSPEVWQSYLKYRVSKKQQETGKQLSIHNINFRDKSNGWESYSLSLSFSDKCGNIYTDDPQCWQKDQYMQSFLKNLNMRDCCFHCRFRNQRSGADITIGDYWGFSSIYPNIFDDKKGINALIVNTEKGKKILQGIKFDGFETSYESIVKGNVQLTKSHLPHINRRYFLQYIGVKDFGNLVSESLKVSFLRRLMSKVRTLYYLYLNTNRY